MASSIKNKQFNANNKEGSVKSLRFPPKPVVLSSQRYQKLLNNATTMENSKEQKQLVEELKHREQLKAGNDELVAKFSGNMPPKAEDKTRQKKEDLERKTQQAKEFYEQTKENEAKKRREKIAKAEQLIEKLKPGPRQLHTAALQSEVLRARNVQRDINEEFHKAIKKQESEGKQAYEGQALSWIHEEQKRLQDKQKNENLYKEEIFKTVKENEKQRNENKKRTIKEEQKAGDAVKAETKAHIEREMALMEKKRVTLRQNALEAMKMVEQRRLREKISDTIQDRLCGVYNSGKYQLNYLRAEQTKKQFDEHQQKIANEVKRLTAIEDNSKAIEAERLRRDISTMQLKFTAEEQEKIRKDKAAKQARIEAHMREMQELKEAEQRTKEKKRFEMAQRMQNTEVNYQFAEKDRQERLTNACEMRAFLDKQVQEYKQNRLAEKQANITSNKAEVEKEDKFFFEYARNLMEDAQQKDRPLYPFIKAVQQYKKDHEIDCERKVPRHMKTHLTIGRATANDNKKQPQAMDEMVDARQVKEDKNSARENILQNCLKINEIITKAGKNKADEAQDVQPDEDDGELAAAAIAKPAKLEGSAKLRYSVKHLKQLNQYAAPSCH